MRERLSAEMPGNLTVSNNTVLVLGAEINTAQTRDTDYNFPALILGIFLIVVIICGNLLVCLSVYREKALKTTTNYFIVSLAVADLMLAVLVLPLFIYVEVSNYVSKWYGSSVKAMHFIKIKTMCLDDVDDDSY